MTADELLAMVKPLTDCEWKAAYRYDDGRRSVEQLADQILGVCTAERLKVREASCLSLNDPDVDSDEFREAVETVEHVREGSVGKK